MRKYQNHFSVFLISLILLSLEIIYTRIFSVLTWYHFTFLLISISMLGLGSSGVFYYLISNLVKNIAKVIKIFLFLFPLTIVLGLWLIVNIHVTEIFVFFQAPIIVYYLSVFSSFFTGGLILTHLIKVKSENISSIYFSDLLGASLGGIFSILILGFLTAENSIVLLGIISTIPAFILINEKGKYNLPLLLIIFVFLILFVSNAVRIEDSPTKGLFKLLEKDLDTRITMTKYNFISRLDVTDKTSCAFWANGTKWIEKCPQAYNIYIDADATTKVLKDSSNLTFLASDISNIGYYIEGSKDSALIIGSGGGIDALTAYQFGFKNITAVEINPDIVSFTDKINPNIYNRPTIQLFIDNGRSFLERSKVKYDFIQISLTDSWAAVSNGAYGLTENYLYTVESFESYYDHLTENGTLSITRWSLERSAIIDLAKEILFEKNKLPQNHILVFSENNSQIDTILIKKNEFSIQDITRLDKKAEELEFQPQNILMGLYNTPYGQDIPRDDRPFYFAYFALPVGLVDSVLFFSLSLVFLLILLPLIFLRKIKILDLKLLPLFFAFLGLGYMFLEIFLIQKFLIVFGAPSLSFSVILISLLVGSGFGSLYSEKLKRYILHMVFILFSLFFVLKFFLGDILTGLHQLDILYRILTVGLLTFPIGFCLGIFLPTGINISRKINENHVAYLWGISGIFSVIGTIVAFKITLLYGFSLLLDLVMVLYLFSSLIIIFYKKWL